MPLSPLMCENADIHSCLIGRFLTIFNRQKDIKLAQPNFQYEKRQKELAKKKKQEEKKQRKLDEKNTSGGVLPAQPDDGKVT